MKNLLTKSYWFVDPAGIFLVYSLIFGIFFVFATAPAQAPDEFAHFSRAYSVSNLQFFPVAESGKIFRIIPKSFNGLKNNRMHHNNEIKYDFDQLKECFKAKLDPDLRVNYYSHVPEYSPINYIIPAFGILLGKLFHSPPILLMYLGRLFNLFAWIAIIYAAIRITTFYKNVFLVISLLPIKLFLAASLSGDNLVGALVTVFIAFILKFAFTDERVSKTELLWLIIVWVLILMAKGAAYAPLTLMVLLIPGKRISSLISFRPSLILILSGGILLALFFFYKTMIFSAWRDPLSNTGLHWEAILNGKYQMVLCDTLVKSFDQIFLSGGVGILGWLDIILPRWIIIGYFTVGLGVALLDNEYSVDVGLGPKTWIAMLIILNANIIFFAMWLFNSVKLTYISDAQGRYLAPFWLPFALLFYNRVLKFPKKAITVLAGLGILVILLGVSRAILTRYWF